MLNFEPLQYFMEHMMLGRTPGNAVEVYLKGERVFQYACGYSDWENQIPLNGSELYNIYSCSKVSTVTAALQLVERGLCKLDDPLYAYIPEFKQMYIKSEDGVREAKNPILLRHLFTMTSGLTYNTQSEGFQKAREITGGQMDTLETMRCIAMDPLSFEPGEHWQYSLSHDMLGAVVQAITGKKFRDYMRENIFEPLQMNETCYHHTPETLARTAQQYQFVAEGGQVPSSVLERQSGNGENKGTFQNIGKENTMNAGPEYDSGGASVITSVSDYAKFTAALANYGMGITGERILKPETVEMMRQNQLNPVQLQDLHKWRQLAGCGYGLGVRTHMSKEESGVCGNLGEFGWGGAAGATVIIDPEIGLGVFYAQHIQYPREEYYQPRLRDIVYRCL